MPFVSHASIAMINARWIIVDVLTLGQAALLAIGLGAGAFVIVGAVGATTLLMRKGTEADGATAGSASNGATPVVDNEPYPGAQPKKTK